jgi:hypothetical protein
MIFMIIFVIINLLIVFNTSFNKFTILMLLLILILKNSMI